MQQLAPERVKGCTIDVMLNVRWKSGREPAVDPRDVAGLRPRTWRVHGPGYVGNSQCCYDSREALPLP